jgi:hypothetical protein
VAATEGVNLLTADTALARACTKVGVRVRLITQATRT